MEQEAAAAPEPVAVGPVTVAFVAAGVSLDVLADGAARLRAMKDRGQPVTGDVRDALLLGAIGSDARRAILCDLILSEF